MGSGKHRWRLSFHRSPSSSPSPTPDPPPEFVCPLASTLMADPVVVPSGHTFERSAIQACNDLHFVPPIISSFQASPLILIPNSALRSAILRWCELSGHPLPAPLPLESALDLVRRLMASDGGPKSCSTSSGDATASVYSVSSCSSSEIVEETPDDPLESEILSKLKDPRVSEQESALISLERERARTGESRSAPGGSSRPSARCSSPGTKRSKPTPLPRWGDLQHHYGGREQGCDRSARRRAAAAPPLLPAIRGGSRSAGCDSDLPPLSSSNRARVVKTPGAVRAVLAVAKEGGEVGRVAMMVLCVLASGHDGRTLMMDAGAVAALVEILKKEVEEEKEKRCVAVIYKMSRGSG
ncbi:hypothetical protein J5N97_005080 [Dioscorea zingiberensis]|uniref:U-box domain-containing protein n=1 Tax=Dioscorea zingiberensis TaxID=325984 RepID=A0A9D5D956_9LILI|nr:hypothetical protein J5N97_005080 [Dioscorea zingiberensis]